MRLLVITQRVDENSDILGFFTLWLRALSNRFDRVDVICLAKGEHHLPSNVHVYSLGKERKRLKLVQGIFFYIYGLLLLPKADGVFIHMAPEYVKALHPLNKYYKKPVIMWYAHIKVSPTARWAIDHVNWILTPSKESFELDSSKVLSTGHGIDTEAFSPREYEPVADVLVLSRISKVKRIETLIEAIRHLKSRSLRVTVDIYGDPARVEDGEYMQDLKNMVDRYGLQSDIHWKGGIANKSAPDVYGSHRIFVRLQGGGGFGKTELEAMSVGVPAIVPTPVYKAEFLELGRDLYFPEDDVLALSDRIRTVLGWPEDKKESYRKIARALVIEKHNVENVASKISELIKSCVA
ncbi:glycosyltransferase family 4 protein [Candidatus Parcubacteria bacterium]|nr:glycosyltransferase family 4 protein [Candidatus Parcubacteria bacterium]